MSQQTPILEVKNLKKHFDIKRGVSVKALENINVSIFEGEKFGVVGESGCGKSTLGRVILQLYAPTSGSCVYHGMPREQMLPKYLKKEIEKLPEYQQKAKNAFQKALQAEQKISALQGKEAKESTTENLAAKAKAYRSEADRHLMEGAKTVGSLILCAKLPEIQSLFLQSYLEYEKAHQLLCSCDKMEAEAKKKSADGTVDQNTKTRVLDMKERAKVLAVKAESFQLKAFEYKGKSILAITDTCQTLEYLQKLDDAYETGISLGKLSVKEMRTLRHDMQMIFQDPAASLDPRQSVGKAIEEVFVINTDETRTARRKKTIELLEQVGLKAEHYFSYPHALSGGQKQRVGIARAIALDPKFIVLDESVSALDVSVQAQILELLNQLSQEKHLTYLFITHDLGVVKYFCDRILVMYLGNVCELADRNALFHNSLHPYTSSLLASVPRPVVRDEETEDEVLEGEVPSALNPPLGCPFHTRCPHCMDICKQQKPPLVEKEPGHYVACFLHQK